jgi:hypothetical protein
MQVNPANPKKTAKATEAKNPSRKAAFRMGSHPSAGGLTKRLKTCTSLVNLSICNLLGALQPSN